MLTGFHKVSFRASAKRKFSGMTFLIGVQKIKTPRFSRARRLNFRIQLAQIRPPSSLAFLDQDVFQFLRGLDLVDFLDRGQFARQTFQRRLINLAFAVGCSGWSLPRCRSRTTSAMETGSPELIFDSYSCARRLHITRRTFERPCNVETLP